MILSLLKKPQHVEVASSLYRTAMDQARDPIFYSQWQVSDSFEARFEMVVLHVFLVIDRLRDGESEAQQLREEVSQQLFNAMFRNLDDTLREMGVGDLSVARKVRKMAEAFYGRSAAYDEALKSEKDSQNQLITALSRNIYASSEGEEHHYAPILAAYVMRVREALNSQPEGRISAGIVSFPDVLSQQDSEGENNV